MSEESNASEQSVAATAQLNFSLNNPDAPGTIYVSTNPADNTLTLVMSSTVVAGFTAGTMVPPDQAQTGTGSLLYLYITPLGLTDAEFEAIKMVSDGWTATLYSGTSGQYIGFTPTAPLTLQPAPTSITFSVNDFTLAQAPGNSAMLYVLTYRVTGIAGNFPASSNIGVIFTTPDDNTGDLTTAMAVSLTPDQVVNSVSQYPAIANQLVLTLAQQPNAPTIKAGDDTAFTLNFVYATDTNGYGALFNTDEGKQLQVTAAQGTTSWQINPHLEADPPFWTLVPPAGKPLFTGGAGSTLAFDLGDLVTTFQPGPTQVILGYSNVTGYKNGSFAITLVKEPHVVISNISVTPEPAILSDGQADVTLNWSTTNATRLTLQPLGTDVTGQTGAPATIDATTQFTLVAEGQRPGNVDNVASLSVLAQVLPVINGFTASPASIYVGDFGNGYPTNLAWNVNTNDEVTLTSSTTGPVGPLYPPVSSAQLPLSTPQMLTLTPKGGSQDPTVSRSLIVSGFQIEAQQATINNDSGYCAAPSNAGFVAVTAPGNNLVSILSTANYAAITTVPTGKKPLGIAFSADGSLMYVANSGDGTVSIFTIAATQSTPAFSFTPAATVQVGGAPQSVVVGQNGTAWASVDLGAGKNGQAVAITNSGGQYAAGSPLTVGQAPRGVSLSPSGASLYVPCSGDGSIWMVTITGGTPAVGKILSGLNTPLATAITPDGKKLLVASQGDGAVYAYNTQTPATSPRQTMAVPGATGLAVFPTGDYALATGASPNNAVLLNYATASISATQALPAAPLSAAITPEGGLGVIALPGSNMIEVITFSQYAEVASTTAAGGQITNVAVSPDNQTLVGWSDAMIGTSTGGTGAPLTGLVKGPVSGIGFSPYLAGTAINWAAISPVPGDDALYIAPHGASKILVYKLSTMASVATIPIQGSGPAGRQPVALGVSADGKTLFALVADTGTQFSMVVIAANIATKAFSVAADLVVYTARMQQLATPMAVLPALDDGASAWTVDTTNNNLWQVSGSGSNWQVASSPIVLAPGNHGASASAMGCSPDGSTAYVALTQGMTNYISVADLAAGTATLIELPDSTMVMNLTSLAVSADGQSLYASDSAGAGIRILNAQSLRIDQTMTWQSGVQAPWGIAAASDGSGLFSANVNSQNIAIAQQVSPT